MTSNKQGRQSVIVDRIGYDKEGHTVYTKLGNGTETTYTYDKQRERLQVMNLTADGQTVMENRYRYDAVDNILGITNAANPTSLTKLNRAKLGGRSSHTYEYDELNRLIHANGKAKRASYDMVMSFGRMSEPLTKVQKVDSTTTAKSYNFAYKYEDSNHPTAPTQIGHDHYTYDANGNPTLVTNDSTNTTREMYWDEDNRLMVLSDNGKTSRYTYNAAGERIMKSYGTMEGVYINGAPQGITFHETDNFTLYPASIISINKNRFTKHYFIGDKRIASKIGTGQFNNVYGINGNIVTAGQRDYAARMQNIEAQREEYYKKLGTPPGVPTMKGNYADPENTGVGYNTIIGELGDHSVPKGWPQTPKFSQLGTPPGPPVQWNPPTNPEDVPAGYGYVANDTTREETFFYHSDHLGSTSYITDKDANITQFDAYLPYGELLVGEHSSSEDMSYKFNGKELDEETGLYYYGARYMDPKISMWLGIDPLVEKYPSVNGYCYTFSDPIGFIDPFGQEGEGAGNTSWWGKNNMTTRAIGALQMVGGAVEAVVGGIGGLVTAETLGGAALGYAALLNGIDNTQAGFNQMWTGTTQQTLLHQVVETNAQKLGATKQTAENIATGVDLSTIFLGGGTSLSTVRGLRATKAANNFFKDTKYTEKVMKQMGNSSDVFHGFSKSVDAYAAKYGKVTQIRGGDKKIYQMLTIKGSITDKSGKTINGTFEYIKTPTGEINHRFFKAATKK